MKIVVVAVCALLVCAFAQDDFSRIRDRLGDRTVDVRGQGNMKRKLKDGKEIVQKELQVKQGAEGGELDFGTEDKIDSKENGKRIKIRIVGVFEKDANGADVEDTADTNRADVYRAAHRRRFDKVKFLSTASEETTFQGIAATSWTMAYQGFANISTAVAVKFWVMNGAGTITNGDETYDVVAGSFKINFEIFKWDFCRRCNKTGEFIDLLVAFNDGDDSREGKRLNDDSDRKKPQQYDIGLGKLILSRVIVVDGVTTSMPEGFPKQIRDDGDGRQVYVFRFPRFTTSLQYDPAVTLNDDYVEDTSASSAASSVHMSLAMLVAALVALFLF